MRDPAGRMTGQADIDTAVWLQRHGAALRRYFRRRVDAADVDDLVQEVLLRLQTSVPTTVGSAERYIFTVARHVLIDRHRFQQTRDLADYAAYARIAGPGDHLSPERILLARDEYIRVRLAIDGLPPRARIAFEYHRFDHKTYQEIARIMQISHASVKELVHRALVAIAAQVPRAEPPRD